MDEPVHIAAVEKLSEITREISERYRENKEQYDRERYREENERYNRKLIFSIIMSSAVGVFVFKLMM